MKKILLIGLAAFALCFQSCEKDDVKDKVIKAKELSLDKAEVNIVEGSTLQLTASVLPETTTDKTLEWTSSDDNILKVSETGLLTAVKAGKATVNVSTSNGIKAICEVNVEKKVIHVTSINISKTTADLEKNKTLQLTCTVLPANATNKDVIWTSEDDNYATVTSGGLVTAKYAGDIDITVTSVDGSKKATCTITVIDNEVKVTSITLNKSAITLKAGTSEQLVETILPEDAANKDVYWTTDDKSVATVSITGLVSSVAVGTTKITVVTAEGFKMAECDVTVEEAPVGDSFTDARDGKSYKIVTIGNQTWMAENFAYLPSVDLVTHDSYTDACYYVYDYLGGNVEEAKETDNYKSFGVLYNKAAALEACPDGWHLPTDAEWKELEIALGMPADEADKENFSTRGNIAEKFKSATGWYLKMNGTNESGFNVLPAGKRNIDGEFSEKEFRALFWTATQGNLENNSYRREFSYYSKSIMRSYKATNKNGMSVRYVRD